MFLELGEGVLLNTEAVQYVRRLDEWSCEVGYAQTTQTVSMNYDFLKTLLIQQAGSLPQESPAALRAADYLEQLAKYQTFPVP